MDFFICPVCCSALKKQNKSYVCPNRHTFDISREGYVNLLPSGKANSAVPGDNKEMVSARTLFLETGAYKLFADGIAKTASDVSLNVSPVILDAGCGQGYYDRVVKDCIPQSEFYGLDISKFAVKYAASHNKDITYSVAGVYDMPVADSSADIILSIFSPIAEKEFLRTCASGGHLIIAVPGPRHLFGLKEILYDKPYENDIIKTEYEGFNFVDRIPLKSQLNCCENKVIMSLFAMTPYYWKTDINGHEKLKNTSKLETELEFDILVYKKR
ncbi:MAG: methyltransferase domain-containing protein [Ruminococcaceae bacterium]|nr:methyltransferase domain-containing protein [Oscillospiraceae bacterium]